MIYYIKEYPDYYFENDILHFKTIKGKVKVIKETIIKKGIRYKVKNINNKWGYVAKSKLLSLAGLILKLPETAKEIPNFPGYYIDHDSNIYSFNINYPRGIILKPVTDNSGYLAVGLSIKNNKTWVNVHKLMLITFLMQDYVEKGFCCMHLDNNKQNNKLTNLAVGTYSENNKAAYRDGLNPGNGLKKS